MKTDEKQQIKEDQMTDCTNCTNVFDLSNDDFEAYIRDNIKWASEQLRYYERKSRDRAALLHVLQEFENWLGDTETVQSLAPVMRARDAYYALKEKDKVACLESALKGDEHNKRTVRYEYISFGHPSDDLTTGRHHHLTGEDLNQVKNHLNEFGQEGWIVCGILRDYMRNDETDQVEEWFIYWLMRPLHGGTVTSTEKVND